MTSSSALCIHGGSAVSGGVHFPGAHTAAKPRAKTDDDDDDVDDEIPAGLHNNPSKWHDSRVAQCTRNGSTRRVRGHCETRPLVVGCGMSSDHSLSLSLVLPNADGRGRTRGQMA